ncbi:MAG: 4-hydroxy-tetrahydrodipicolinate reductase [Nitrososphaerota archaeon]|nr:4-hydroxy-tetrahydrodipicolinate reductase [Nitrososphaerota archaeon]
MTTTDPIRLCVAGATGRMGTALLQEMGRRFVLSAAVTSADNRNVGKRICDISMSDCEVVLSPPGRLGELLDGCDVFVSFTNASVELVNAEAVAASGKPAVIGTTGFDEKQSGRLASLLRRVPTVMASNFSIGANMLSSLARELCRLPPTFDMSMIEAHHSKKLDSPSGTARDLSKVIMRERGYERVVNGRSGMSRREKEELEVLSVRAGGIPGIHTILAAGDFESIRIEHTVFSRSSFAQGALLAAAWVLGKPPGIYGMGKVLGLE